MRASNAPQTTDRTIVTKSRSYVVYDKTTGDIQHIHHTVTFPHGAPGRETAEARARRYAGSKLGATADIIEVDTAEVNHRIPVRIDPLKRAVVPAT